MENACELVLVSLFVLVKICNNHHIVIRSNKHTFCFGLVFVYFLAPYPITRKQIIKGSAVEECVCKHMVADAKLNCDVYIFVWTGIIIHAIHLLNKSHNEQGGDNHHKITMMGHWEWWTHTTSDLYNLDPDSRKCKYK